MPKLPLKPKSGKGMGAYARYSSLSLQMGVIIAGGTFGGYKIDKWLNIGFPIFTLVLSLLSVGAAIYVLIREVSKPNDEP